MALTIKLVPGYTFTDGEVWAFDKFNSLGNPTITLEGSISSTSIADGSVTTAKLATGVLSADATGASKMANGFLSADATGRAKFAAGFFGTDATSLAIFADGFFATVAPVVASVRNLVVQPTQLTSITLGVGELTSSTTTATVTHTAHGFSVGQSVSVSGASPAAYNGIYVITSVADANHFTYTFAGGTSPATGTIVIGAWWNSRVTVTADEVVMKDSASSPFLASSVSVTADITTSGANGLDTGSEASSTWYYVWLVYNGTTTSSLLSVSATAPTMPSTYTHKALLGAVRNDGSSNFIAFYQQDRTVWINDIALFASHAGSATYANLSGADLTAFQAMVPPIAKRVRGYAGCQSSTTDGSVAVAADANGLGAVTITASHGSGSAALNGYDSSGAFELPLKTAQNFYYKMDSTGSRYGINVTGYQI